MHGQLRSAHPRSDTSSGVGSAAVTTTRPDARPKRYLFIVFGRVSIKSAAISSEVSFMWSSEQLGVSSIPVLAGTTRSGPFYGRSEFH